ncbi:hypothetical protein ABT010_28700 [Streptomyces sp. NPDC002668]|uniref:hypothetical protein n=1 Tax=Streptomyces sp. NPDC002668 TaxID=3154422 RepID=UPI00333495CE
MNTDYLRELADNLRLRGMTVGLEAEHCVRATNPMHKLITTAIRLVGDRYVTEYDYEVGERGDEPASAGRIAHLLAMPQREEVVRRCTYCLHVTPTCACGTLTRRRARRGPCWRTARVQRVGTSPRCTRS